MSELHTVTAVAIADANALIHYVFGSHYSLDWTTGLAYLISFNEKIRRAVTLNRKQTLAFVEA